MNPAAHLPSLPDQIRAAAAHAARVRAESCRAQLNARKSETVMRMNRQRLELLRLMASKPDRTTRELHDSIAARDETSDNAFRNLLDYMRQRGWAQSYVRPGRQGVHLGTSRINRWRITPLGSAALTELAELLVETSDVDTAEAPAETNAKPRTGAH